VNRSRNRSRRVNRSRRKKRRLEKKNRFGGAAAETAEMPPPPNAVAEAEEGGEAAETDSLLDAPQIDLIEAVKTGNINEVRSILQSLPGNINKADFINQKKKGLTALYIAAKHGKDDIVVELLKQDGIRVNMMCENVTPLHVATGQGHINVVKHLLDAGAAQIGTHSLHPGITPLTIAMRTSTPNGQEIMGLLENQNPKGGEVARSDVQSKNRFVRALQKVRLFPRIT